MTAAESMNSILRSVEQATGKPVVIEVDPSLPLHATLTIAREDMPVHIVRYRAEFEPERAYLVSYQCGFILRHAQAGPHHQLGLAAIAIAVLARRTAGTLGRGIRADLVAERKRVVEK